MDVSVSVVVISWNDRDHLKRCLPSIVTQTVRPLEIIVVDNGSRDGSTGWIRNSFPQVRLIENSDNLGFAMAINQALEIARGDFIATLNSDAWAEPNWLAEFVRATRGDATVGMWASKMLFANRRSIINSTGINVDWAGIAWDRRAGEVDDEQENQPLEIFGPCAGAALYRKAMLEELGGFDEMFFLYLEDVDLAWRAQLAGWRCLYIPSAVVYHHHSASLGEGSPIKNYLLVRNKIWSVVKNYPAAYLLKYLPVILLYDLGMLLLGLARGDWSALQGRWAALLRIRTVWRRRQIVQSSIRDKSGWLSLMQPIEFPWQVHNRYSHLRLAKSDAVEQKENKAR